MRIIGLIISMVIITLGITNGGDLASFIDIPSAIIVLAIPTGCLLLAGARIGIMFKAIFSASVTPEELKAAATGWGQARRYVLAAGWIGVLVGLVIMLKNLDDPSAIGPGLAMALLTAFYATVLAYVVFLPLQSRLGDRAHDQ